MLGDAQATAMSDDEYIAGIVLRSDRCTVHRSNWGNTRVLVLNAQPPRVRPPARAGAPRDLAVDVRFGRYDADPRGRRMRELREPNAVARRAFGDPLAANNSAEAV